MPRRKGKEGDDVAAAAVRVTIEAIRDSADAFPLVKSAASAVIVVWDISKKTKCNKEDCERLANRAVEIVGEIWSQMEHQAQPLGDVQQSINRIVGIFEDIAKLMEILNKQGIVARYAHQDNNRKRIDNLHKLLGEGLQAFMMSLLPSAMERLIFIPQEHEAILNISQNMSQLSRKEKEQYLCDARVLMRSGGLSSSYAGNVTYVTY